MIDRETAWTPEEARIDALLRDAASFVPEHAAPNDLCSRALLSRRPISAPNRASRSALLAASAAAAALAAFSVACALSFVSRPKITSNQVAASGPVSKTPAVENINRIAQDRPLLPAPLAVIRNPERLYTARRGRLKAHRAFAVSRTAHKFVQPFARHKEPAQVAAVTAKPAAAVKSCWTTEEVLETKYVLVSPGIVTDGSGDSERATPVLVQLPIANDDAASEGDESASSAESTTP